MQNLVWFPISIIIPMRVGEFIEIRHKKFHPLSLSTIMDVYFYRLGISVIYKL